MENENYWDKRSGSYDNLQWVNSLPFDKLLSDTVFQIAKELNDTIFTMDLGCGTGKVATKLAENPLVQSVFAVDLSKDMLDQIPKDKHDKIIKIHSDIRKVKTEKNKLAINLITARMLFHHIDDPVAALKHLRPLMAPNGQMFICEGNPPTHREVPLYDEIFKHKEQRSIVLEGDLVYWLDQAGFYDITLRPYWVRKVSLRNWLQNSGTPEDKQEIIWDLHKNAPKEFKQAYKFVELKGDILMDWKFTVATGRV